MMEDNLLENDRARNPALVHHVDLGFVFVGEVREYFGVRMLKFPFHINFADPPHQHISHVLHVYWCRCIYASLSSHHYGLCYSSPG